MTTIEMVLTNIPTSPDSLPTPIPFFKTDTVHTMTEEVIAPTVEESVIEQPALIFPVKIPLVSFQPVLATAPNFILTNERTKRRNRFVLFDSDQNESTIPSSINKPVLDALWVEHHQEFLLLTEQHIFRLDPHAKSIQILPTIKPKKSKIFKCFTLLDQSVLLIAYNEWNTTHLGRWKASNEPGSWTCMERQEMHLTADEVVDHMRYCAEGRQPQISVTVFNQLTEQWRIEFRNPQTFHCLKTIFLPGSDSQCIYRMISVNDNASNLQWLIYSPENINMIALDSQWEKIPMDYAHPVQRMAVFAEKYLVVRTLERVDIHHFA